MLSNNKSLVVYILLAVLILTIYECACWVVRVFNTHQSEIITSNWNWNTWSSDDYGPNCVPQPCYDGIAYQMGVTFIYPTFLKDRGYQDMGGGYLFSDSSDPLNNAVYLDCFAREPSELNDLMGLPPFPTQYHDLKSKKNISIGPYKGLEAVLTLSPNVPEEVLAVRRPQLDQYRDIRFYIPEAKKVCWIEASLAIDRAVLDTMISSFRAVR